MNLNLKMSMKIFTKTWFFDFSNYLKGLNYYYCSINNLVVDKTIDGTYSVPIKRIVGLIAKMYACITKNAHECKSERY